MKMKIHVQIVGNNQERQEVSNGGSTVTVVKPFLNGLFLLFLFFLHWKTGSRMRYVFFASFLLA